MLRENPKLLINKEMPESYRQIFRKFPGLLDHTVIEKSDIELQTLLLEELVTALLKPEIAFPEDPLGKSFERAWEKIIEDRWTLKALYLKFKEIWEREDKYFSDLRWVAKRPDGANFNLELEEKIDVEIDVYGNEKYEEELIKQDVLHSSKTSIFNEIDKNIKIKELEEKNKKLESEVENLRIQLKELKRNL